ncbi:hypothetical protein [Corallococcus llansteffanensis]|uniref:Secreted protein n=1 Tax=Corallococcus llansteffanensis TaxID=2316731 RepID=A0A3A8PXD4_9BACT|nr:hypothetical protein [Corallococcus llansteffanensis]RKH59611.1 hypothetical protein D7V93_14705 [Corallococcus llansteffanensis]
MTSRRPFPTLLTITAFLLTSPLLASADEAVQREKYIACLNMELTQMNKEFRISEADLKKLTVIVDKEINKEPHRKTTPAEQRKTAENIMAQAKKDIPDVPAETVSKMMKALTQKGKHCSLSAPE